MLTLYDNPFSPFARKVRLVLHYKGLAHDSLDALALAHLPELGRVNPRREVPVLVDGDIVVADSRDIVAYLEDRYPRPPVLPGNAATRAVARAWERIADTLFDAIIHDISLWTWPTHRRDDRPPAGLVEAGLRDIARLLARLEDALPRDGFLCGTLSIADLALFPHLTSVKTLGVAIDPATQPRLAAWNRRMRTLPCVQDDVAHVKRAASEKFVTGPSPYEAEKVVWRGDRLEWLFRNGGAAWWQEEFAAGRAVLPESL